MFLNLIATIAAPLALQAATPTTSTRASEPPSDLATLTLDDLPIEEAAAPRCGIAFAVVSRWQKGGDGRGSGYPDMENTGGREFFVRAMAALMESRELSREAISQLIYREVENLDDDEGETRVESMMPACLMMKDAAAL